MDIDFNIGELKGMLDSMADLIIDLQEEIPRLKNEIEYLYDQIETLKFEKE